MVNILVEFEENRVATGKPLPSCLVGREDRSSYHRCRAQTSLLDSGALTMQERPLRRP